MKEHSNNLVSQGIEDLIKKIKNEAVLSGKEQASKIIEDAKKEAESIISKAEADSSKRLKKVQEEANKEKKATKEALELAGRDMILKFQANISESFKEEIKNIISCKLKDKDLISKLLLIACGKSIEEVTGLKKEGIEIFLPKKVISLSDIRKDPKLINKDDSLTEVTLEVAKDVINKGFTIHESDCKESGISIKVSGSNITLDITEKALTKALLQHLQPRFYALLEGLIK